MVVDEDVDPGDGMADGGFSCARRAADPEHVGEPVGDIRRNEHVNLLLLLRPTRYGRYFPKSSDLPGMTDMISDGSGEYTGH
jgi:hypothetical protein